MIIHSQNGPCFRELIMYKLTESFFSYSEFSNKLRNLEAKTAKTFGKLYTHKNVLERKKSMFCYTVVIGLKDSSFLAPDKDSLQYTQPLRFENIEPTV